MINFKSRDEAWPSVVTISSLVVMAGTFAFMLYGMVAKPPTLDAFQKNISKQSLQAKIATKTASERMDSASTEIDQYTWEGESQDVQTAALKSVSKLAESQKVKLAAFRPQRPAPADDLSTLPFQITVEGTFLTVMAFERAMEDPKNKLGVSSIQLSSTDPNTDKVTANIGLVVYLQPKDPTLLATPSKSGGTNHA